MLLSSWRLLFLRKSPNNRWYNRAILESAKTVLRRFSLERGRRLGRAFELRDLIQLSYYDEVGQFESDCLLTRGIPTLVFEAWAIRERGWRGHRAPRREDELKTAISPTWASIAEGLGMSLSTLKRALARAEALIDDRVWRRACRTS